MKKSLLIFIGWLLTEVTFAQGLAQPTKTFTDNLFNDPILPFHLVMVSIVAVIILVGVVAFYMLQVIDLLTEEPEKEKALKLGIIFVPPPGWWQKFTQRMNDSVPVAQENKIELDHSYDGIKELDNHLPPWWKWLFIGTIAWAGIYIIVFHLTDTLPLPEEEYQNEIALAEDQAIKFKAAQPQASIDANTLEYVHDPGIIEKGKTVFINNNCSSCHRTDGGGNTIGPNLTDEYWLHGGNLKDVFNTIKNGAVEKGMPEWGKALSPQDMRDVTFFIMSLQGTKPANAKIQQGEIYKQVNTVTKDSAKLKTEL